MNKANLLKLADFLDTVKPEAFDIANFSNGDPWARKPAAICGTVACALGWAPMVIPVEPGDFCLRFEGCPEALNWTLYCERVFCFRNSTKVWAWCFASFWEEVDNTPTGAAKRIRYLVEHGAAPSDTFLQIHGQAPYIFNSGEQS